LENDFNVGTFLPIVNIVATNHCPLAEKINNAFFLVRFDSCILNVMNKSVYYLSIINELAMCTNKLQNVSIERDIVTKQICSITLCLKDEMDQYWLPLCDWCYLASSS
jgi:hypothetical protein